VNICSTNLASAAAAAGWLILNKTGIWLLAG